MSEAQKAALEKARAALRAKYTEEELRAIASKGGKNAGDNRHVFTDEERKRGGMKSGGKKNE